jgi:hypothetical protein
MEEAVEPESHLSPGFLGLLALFAIGGLLFIGWQSSSITGGYISSPYYVDSPHAVCCTVEPWGTSQSGYRPGNGLTTTEVCSPREMPQRCCVRQTSKRYHSPVKLLDASEGACFVPEVSYPAGGTFSTCCTTQTYRSAPTGFIQGNTETKTESCYAGETPNGCCARAAAERTVLKIKVLGSRTGSCERPEKSYPAPVAGGYSACCTAETWRNAPIGYTQGNAETSTVYCEELESVSQCCNRVLSQVSDYPFKLLGFKAGSCRSSPDISYPLWVR